MWSFFFFTQYLLFSSSFWHERDSPCASTHGRKRNKEESDDDHRLLWPPEELPPAFTIFFIFWLTPAHNNRSVSQLGIESKPIVLIGFRQSVCHYEEVQVEWRLLRAIENPHLVVTGSGPVGKVILNQFSVHVTWLTLLTGRRITDDMMNLKVVWMLKNELTLLFLERHGKTGKHIFCMWPLRAPMTSRYHPLTDSLFSDKRQVSSCSYPQGCSWRDWSIATMDDTTSIRGRQPSAARDELIFGLRNRKLLCRPSPPFSSPPFPCCLSKRRESKLRLG